MKIAINFRAEQSDNFDKGEVATLALVKLHANFGVSLLEMEVFIDACGFVGWMKVPMDLQDLEKT